MCHSVGYLFSCKIPRKVPSFLQIHISDYVVHLTNILQSNLCEYDHARCANNEKARSLFAPNRKTAIPDNNRVRPE